MRRTGFKDGQRYRAVSQSVQSLYGAMVMQQKQRLPSAEPLIRGVAILQDRWTEVKIGLRPMKEDMLQMKSSLQSFEAAYQLSLNSIYSDLNTDIQSTLPQLQASIDHEAAVSRRLTAELKALNAEIREVRSALRHYGQQLQRLEVFVGPKTV